MMNDESIWFDLTGFNGKYLINKTGEIKRPKWPSVRSRGKIMIGGYNLKKCEHPGGYHYVNLRKDGRKFTELVHRLVAKTFIKNPDNKPYVNHINGIKTDNRVENLEWVTALENCIHASKNGLLKPRKGADNPLSKLTEEQAKEIRSLKNIPPASRPNLSEVGKKYGIGGSLVCGIINGKKWKHLV